MRQFSMNRKTVRTIPVAKPPKTGSLLPNGKRLSYKFRHSTRVINDRGIPFVPQSGCFFLLLFFRLFWFLMREVDAVLDLWSIVVG